MSGITDEHIEFMYADIRQRGITTEGLLHEMVDHLCCVLEPQLTDEDSFWTLYRNFVDGLRQDQFANIQHHTDLAVDLNFQKMKKTMFISGAIGTFMLISGIIFKVNHWPGAGIVLVLATFTIAFLFLPTFFIVSHRENTEKKNVFLSVIGYFTITFLILGPVFRIMHWPFTDFFFFFGPLLLATLFIPFYLVSVFRKANETKTNYLFIIILVSIGFSFLYSLSIANISKEHSERMFASYLNNLKTAEMIAQRIDSAKATDARWAKVQRERAELNALIDSLMLDMIRKTNDANASLTDFGHLDDKKVGQSVLENNEVDVVLYEKIEKYRKILLESSGDALERQMVMSSMELADVLDPYNHLNFKKEPMIVVLYNLSHIRLNALVAEYELLKD